jgi:hypothetical protein
MLIAASAVAFLFVMLKQTKKEHSTGFLWHSTRKFSYQRAYECIQFRGQVRRETFEEDKKAIEPHTNTHTHEHDMSHIERYKIKGKRAFLIINDPCS